MARATQIGRTMTESLRKSKALKWEFVSKQQADDGVRRGYYYAVVTVPEVSHSVRRHFGRTSRSKRWCRIS